MEDVFYYTAFEHLATCRNYELGPIPYTAIVTYAEQNHVEPGELEDLVYVTRKLDNWVIGKEIARLEKGGKGGGKRPKRTG